MTRRTGVMLAYPFSRKRLEGWLKKDSVIVQPKLNGCRAKWDGHSLFTSEANIITSVPHIVEELLFKAEGQPLDGELYVHGMSLQGIRSIVSRTTNRHVQYKQMQYHAFDTPESSVTQFERIQKVGLLRLHSSDYLKMVPTVTIGRYEDISTHLYYYVANGYEGIVLRKRDNLYVEKRSTNMMKWKPRHRDTYEVVSVHEGAGKYMKTLGSLTVKDSDGRSFNVGSFAIDDNARDALWGRRHELIGKMVQIRYAELTEYGVPPSSIFEVVVEQ